MSSDAENRTVDQIAALDGFVYLVGDRTFVVGVPLDGEWIFATGDDLPHLWDRIDEENGRAVEGDGIFIRPYLTREEVQDEAAQLFVDAALDGMRVDTIHDTFGSSEPRP